MMDLKLDSLYKKPKVYGIAILSAVVMTALVLLIALGGEKQPVVVCVLSCFVCPADSGLPPADAL